MKQDQVAKILAEHGYTERIAKLESIFTGGQTEYRCQCGTDISAGYPSHVAAHQAAVIAQMLAADPSPEGTK